MQIPNDLARINRTQLEAWCRQQTQAVNVDDTRILCRVLGKYLMQVDGRDVSLAPHLVLNGYWESWITQFIARTVKPGWTCFDVGANVGYFTLLLADLVGTEGRVLALEPQSRVVTMLQRNVMLNGFHNVRVEHVAADAVVGHVRLELPNAHWGGAAVMGPGDPADGAHDPGCNYEVVACAPLNSFDDAGVPQFVKVDAEGAEPAIFAGMGPWVTQVRKSIPHLLIEWAPDRYDEPAAFLTALERVGYKPALIDGAGHAVATSREYLLGELPQGFEMVWFTKN